MGSPFCLGCLLNEVVSLFLDSSELGIVVEYGYIG
ncbi:hypothetical protein XM77_c20600 [Vibrio vulnificus]|nr:hypothetical protein XM77_c20600 [Vibrio vulnificus]